MTKKPYLKKIHVVITEEASVSFISAFLKRENLNFCIYDLDGFQKESGISPEIKNNDIERLQSGSFNVAIFQSSIPEIPTRLLIPDRFETLENWSKEYYLTHELGHYLSLENEHILSYYEYLESSKLEGELFVTPLEVEAEKYCFTHKRNLFKRNAHEVYGSYLQQLQEGIDKINKESIRNQNNFYQIYEIRLFRYAAVVEEVLSQAPNLYSEHKNNIESIKDLLGTRGALFLAINKTLDPFSEGLRNFYQGESENYVDNCKGVYKLVGVSLGKAQNFNRGEKLSKSEGW